MKGNFMKKCMILSLAIGLFVMGNSYASQQVKRNETPPLSYEERCAQIQNKNNQMIELANAPKKVSQPKHIKQSATTPTNFVLPPIPAPLPYTPSGYTYSGSGGKAHYSSTPISWWKYFR